MAVLLLQHVPIGPRYRDEDVDEYERPFRVPVVITGVDMLNASEKTIDFGFKGVATDAVPVQNAHLPGNVGRGKIWGKAAAACAEDLVRAMETGKPVILKDFVRRRIRGVHTLENNKRSDHANIGQIEYIKDGVRPGDEFFENLGNMRFRRTSPWARVAASAESKKRKALHPSQTSIHSFFA